MKPIILARLMSAALAVSFLAANSNAQQTNRPPRSFAPRFNVAAAETDRQRMMALLHIPNPGPLPPPQDDPKRPPHTFKLTNSPNWSDGIRGHTIVRSSWGNWSNYDPANADRGPLPPVLVLKNGAPVTDSHTWWAERRPEIARAFETEIYGRIPTQTPPITWRVVRVMTNALNGLALRKDITGFIDNSGYPKAAPSIQISLYTPAHSTRPVPTIMILSGGFSFGGPGALQQILNQGWGCATFNTSTVQADNGAALNSGIIGLLNKGRPRQPDDWGVLAAWAWGASRAIDYFETDKNVDARHLGLEGHSRWGKTALLAAALDPRWSVTYCSCSGECGAKLHRHDMGESLDNVCGTMEYHWMAGNFLKYAGHWDDLPIDQHELIALVAPRALFVTGGTQDLWSDPIGEFKACAAASPVYELLGKKGLGTTNMPAPNQSLVTGALAYREHAGGHSDSFDWPVFLKFAAQQWQSP